MYRSVFTAVTQYAERRVFVVYDLITEQPFGQAETLWDVISDAELMQGHPIGDRMFQAACQLNKTCGDCCGAYTNTKYARLHVMTTHGQFC